MNLKLIVLFLLLVTSIGSHAAGKSAFINPQILLEKSPQAIKALSTLESEFKGRERKLRRELEAIQTMEKNYQNDSAIMSEEQRKKVEGEIVQRKRQFQFDQQSVREDLQTRRNELLNEVRQSIGIVIREYGVKQGYDFIFSGGIAFAADSVNITDEILKELKK